MVFISYFTIDAHDTHQLLKLHLMHTSITIWTAAVYDHFLQHTSAASPSAYIILSICERYFRSLTFLLRNRSASTKRKISFRVMHQYELCHYVPLAYWPLSSCSIYTNIYPFGCGWRSHGYPMQYKVLRYRVGSYSSTAVCSMATSMTMSKRNNFRQLNNNMYVIHNNQRGQ